MKTLGDPLFYRKKKQGPQGRISPKGTLLPRGSASAFGPRLASSSLWALSPVLTLLLRAGIIVPVQPLRKLRLRDMVWYDLPAYSVAELELPVNFTKSKGLLLTIPSKMIAFAQGFDFQEALFPLYLHLSIMNKQDKQGKIYSPNHCSGYLPCYFVLTTNLWGRYCWLQCTDIELRLWEMIGAGTRARYKSVLQIPGVDLCLLSTFIPPPTGKYNSHQVETELSLK